MWAKVNRAVANLRTRFRQLLRTQSRRGLRPGEYQHRHARSVEAYWPRQGRLDWYTQFLSSSDTRPKLTTTGHDWGCGSVWTFAAHYPEHCIAAAGMCVPYGIIELGLEELVKTVDRDLYPEDQYPYGQWSYQAYYERDFEGASAFFDADIPALLRASRVRGQPGSENEVSPLAHVDKDNGWLGGGDKPDPKFRHIPLEFTVYESEEQFQEFVAAMEKTGFWPGDAWYSNHAANRKYTLEKRKNEGIIEFPVLFVSDLCMLPSERLSTNIVLFDRSTPLTIPCVRR